LGDRPSEWAAICSIASKIGCTAETLRNRIRQGQRDKGWRPGATTEEQVLRRRRTVGRRFDSNCLAFGKAGAAQWVFSGPCLITFSYINLEQGHKNIMEFSI
jgi:hypothetical protein